MPYICYAERKFSEGSQGIIKAANEIIEEYQRQGYSLTLRQLYYQFVSRDLLANTQKEYKRLGSIINDGRLAGLIDWEAIEDRTRNLAALAHWGSPTDIISACASQFRFDRWANQPYRIEVWVEKEALAGVFDRICKELDVPYFPCRGYVSQSEMWSAAQRLREYEEADQETIILHFGDHDPSGVDMSRDIQERLSLFESRVVVNRIALNMNQINQYQPPPNPAKFTDSRCTGYVSQFGESSWELDALEPSVLSSLVRKNVEYFLDKEKWDAFTKKQNYERERLQRVAEYWPTAAKAASDAYENGVDNPSNDDEPEDEEE